MSEERFNLVFKGELAKSADLETTKSNIGRLFKVSGSTLERLFSGKPITLKKNLDMTAAMKYRAAIKQAGALIDLVEMKAPEPAPKPSQGKAVFGVRDSEAASQPETPSASAIKSSVGAPVGGVEAAVASQVSIPVPDASVAPVGQPLADKKPEVAAKPVDLSGYSVAPSNTELLRQDEREKVEPVQVDVGHLSTAELGVDMTPDENKRNFEELEVDLSGIELAETGANLAEPKPEPPKAPDVSHLQLK